jgi:hypothetical protein
VQESVSNESPIAALSTLSIVTEPKSAVTNDTPEERNSESYATRNQRQVAAETRDGGRLSNAATDSASVFDQSLRKGSETTLKGVVIGGKKLSKIQQKMLASQAARKEVSSSPIVTATLPSACIPQAAEAAKLPETVHFSQNTPLLLKAGPSMFAIALQAEKSLPSASSKGALLAQIEGSLKRASALSVSGNDIVFNEPSPDDVALNARKGTALARGVLPGRK